MEGNAVSACGSSALRIFQNNQEVLAHAKGFHVD